MREKVFSTRIKHSQIVNGPPPIRRMTSRYFSPIFSPPIVVGLSCSICRPFSADRSLFRLQAFSLFPHVYYPRDIRIKYVSSAVSIHFTESPSFFVFFFIQNNLLKSKRNAFVFCSTDFYRHVLAHGFRLAVRVLNTTRRFHHTGHNGFPI